MANSDGTLLCVFSGRDCIIVDDFAQKVQQTLPIGTIWPELAAWGMDNDLDAVCRDDTIGQFIFFKGSQCAVNNFKQKKWSHGMQGNYFILPLPQDNQSPRFSGTICAAIEDAGTISLHAHDPIEAHVSLTGQTTDLLTGAVHLSAAVGIDKAGWPQVIPHPLEHIPAHKEFACTHIFWPTSLSHGTNALAPGMLVQDPQTGRYQCTFMNSSAFTALTSMWQGWTDPNRIDAATRLDLSMIPLPSPSPNPNPNPIPGPGPAPSPNPLCDEFGNIMKSICSLTVLMQKAIDACYPQSSWPTQPYPDGCSSCGCNKQHPCGCQDPANKPDKPTNT